MELVHKLEVTSVAKDSLDSIFDLLRKGTDEEAADLLNQIRASASVNDFVQLFSGESLLIHRGSSLSSWFLISRLFFYHPPGTEISSRGRLTVQIEQLRRFLHFERRRYMQQLMVSSGCPFSKSPPYDGTYMINY